MICHNFAMISSSTLPDGIVALFSGKSVAVIGDLVADQYLNGSIARVSREAPVFILRHDETITLPGGAANAAANIASLGGTAILVGAIGSDPNGGVLSESIVASGVSISGVIASDQVTTTTKVRVLAGQKHAARQQVIRIDYGSDAGMPADVAKQLEANAAAACETADAVIISDYDCGVATKELFETVKAITASRRIPLVVDSRFRLEEFAGATSATPNQDEVEQILGRGFSHADCSSLCTRLGLDALVVTNGAKGMDVFRRDHPPINIPAVGSAQAVDVTGAGDTVIAAYTLGLAAGLSFADAARAANHAGGLVVMKKGTAVVSASELEASLDMTPRVLTSVT